MIKINNIFDSNETRLLAKLKADYLYRVYIDYPAPSKMYPHPDFSLITHVLMKNSGENRLFLLRNDVIDEPLDHDEYSEFKLQLTDDSILNKEHKFVKLINNELVHDYNESIRWHIFDINQKIESVEIYRDHAVWEYNGNKWDVTTDVAIKICCENHRFLFVLQDSIASFMTVHYNYQADENALINEYWCLQKWGIKSTNLTSLHREVIMV